MFVHETVLKEEAVNGLNVKADGIYVDCTLGGAGHSTLISSKLDESGILIGLDQDQNALEHAEQMLNSVKCRLFLIKTNFLYLKEKVTDLGVKKVDGILYDLGVSSPQLDQKDRGFSYQQDAPLDMRMDVNQLLTGFEVVNNWSESEISKILFHYGEEKFSRRIAREIIRFRENQPIKTTYQLVDIIKKAIPAAARRTGPHPARRTFQAIRIAVNDELNIFQKSLTQAIELLKPGGRISVITFHSLEDRICKKVFQEFSKGCICPPTFPICNCNPKPLLKVISKKPILPTEIEIEKNKRSRSAKLRVAEKI